MNKPYPNQKQIAQKQDFKGQNLYFNHKISFDTKGPISPSSEGNSYIMVIDDAFTHCAALNPLPHCNAYYAYTTLYEHCIAKFGLPEILVTDDGTEFINNEIITLCHLYNIKHKPRTSHAPWTNGLVEDMNRSFQKYLRCILNGNDTRYTELSADVKLFPLSYNSQIMTTLGMSPYEMVFNQKPRKLIMFTANAHKNAQSHCKPNKDSICYNLPLHTHDEDQFHHPQILKCITHTEWILNRDKKHNEIYQKVTKKLLQRQNINNQINSRFMPATDLKIGTFVLIPNFTTQKGISKKLQPLRKGPYQINAKPTEVTYKLTDPTKKEIVQHRNNLLPYYPKEYALRKLTQLYSFTGLKIIQNKTSSKLATAQGSTLVNDGRIQLFLVPTRTMEQNKILNKPFKQTFHITDIKHNIIGIPFITKYIPTINILNSKIHIKDKYTKTKNTALTFFQKLNKQPPFFSKFYPIYNQIRKHLKPLSGNVYNF